MLCSNLLEFTDLVTFYDQMSLNKAAKKGEDPTSVASRIFSGVTGPLRFGRCVTTYDGMRGGTLSSIQTNLVPYPRIHFAFAGLATGSREDGGYAASATALSSPLCDVEKGKSIAFALMGRGAEQSCLISRVAAYKLSKEYNFVAWNPTGFGVYTYKDPKSGEAEITALQSTSGVSKVFSSFATGLENCRGQDIDGPREEGIIGEQLENINALLGDYEEVATDVVNPDGGEDGEEFEEE